MFEAWWTSSSARTIFSILAQPHHAPRWLSQLSWELFWASLRSVMWGFLANARVPFRALRVMTSNNALERTVSHGGPRLTAARAAWPAAQLGR